MKIGKVPSHILEKIVLNPIQEQKIKRKEIIIRPKTGEDCSAALLGDELCIVSTDPITGTQKDIGYLAVHINCNDIAASGGEPVGILLTVLLPEGTTEETLSEIMEGAQEGAQEAGIEIMGGHTEITSVVNKPLISGTIIGKTINKRFISSGGAQIGQDVIMTKWAGLEGTVILARDYEPELSKKFGNDMVQKAKSMKGFLSVIKESKIALEFGATAMHDATEGGVLGAVWEVADCSGTGIEIYADQIPIKEETRKICEAANITPYGLISSGTLIITAFEGEKLVKKLLKEDIAGCVIGKIIEKDRILLQNGVRKILKQPQSDEIYSAKIE